ncbi:MAG: glycosyltransferase [Bacteroidia bacterium]
MNYWLLTTEYPPFYGGGISTYCDQTSTMLTRAGYSVTVFVPYYEAPGREESRVNGIRIIRFNPSVSPSSAFLGYEANLSHVFSLTVTDEIQKTGKPDFIEMQEYLGIGYYLLQRKHLGYSELEGIPMLLTLHAPSFLYLDFNQVPVYKHPHFWTGEMERFCIRAADICLSPSAYLLDVLKNRVELDKVDTRVLPNPYDPPQLNQDVPLHTTQEVVFYGKLIPQKGCIELLAYFKEIWESGLKIRLRLIGGGKHFFHPVNMDLGDYLKKKYQKYVAAGLLHFEGSIKPEELEQRLCSAHVIVIPSIVDNLPYTVLETMGIGKIVLTSMQGGQSEVITHGRDGFLFDHGQPGSFRTVLMEILALGDKQIREIGLQAKEKIRSSYASSIISTQKLEILRTLSGSGLKNAFPLIHPPKTSPVHDTESTDDLLTVVIPYYNMGAYLPETIRSIKASGHRNTHIILVNDGSTDTRSLSVLKEYAQDPQIEIIDKANEGLSRARNTGAAASRGGFLAFLDPDDTVEPEYYPRAIKLLQQKNNISFAGCWAQYFGESSDIWPAFNPEPPYVLLHNCMNTSALVYKRAHFIESGLNDASMLYGMEDYESLIGMIEKGYRGVAFPETWWNYRVRKDSMAQAFTINSKLFLYKRIAEKHAGLYSDHGSALFMLLNSNGPSVNIDNPTMSRDFYSKFTSSMPGQSLLRLIKRNKYLRPIALHIYKRLVK